LELKKGLNRGKDLQDIKLIQAALEERLYWLLFNPTFIKQFV
jgi:hypothetical protein